MERIKLSVMTNGLNIDLESLIHSVLVSSGGASLVRAVSQSVIPGAQSEVVLEGDPKHLRMATAALLLCGAHNGEKVRIRLSLP